MKKPKLTYEQLRDFLSGFEDASIAWRLIISKNGIEAKDESYFAVENNVYSNSNPIYDGRKINV